METTVAINQGRTIPEGTRLERGGHGSPDKGLCVMEAVAWVAGEPHSAHPACACPVVGALLRPLSDWMPDEQRQRLLPFVVEIAGSRGGLDVEVGRAFIAADWAVRRLAPMAMDAVGREDVADRLRAVDPVRDRETAERARVVCQEVRAVATEIADAAAAADAAAHAAVSATYAAAAGAVWDQGIACLREMLAVSTETPVDKRAEPGGACNTIQAPDRHLVVPRSG